MEPEELEWLAFEARRHRAIIEVGSYMGRSTRALGDNTLGKVWAVDNWYGPVEMDIPDRDKLYEKFRANVSDLLDKGTLNTVNGDSVLSSRLFADQSADMVFIDASHDKDSVMNDIQAWARVLKPGGLLCGHDAHLEGVKEARRVLLPQHWSGVGDLWAYDNFQGLRP